MTVAPEPIAYLTCELKGRDFASRLLIATHILEAGYPVIVGQQWAIVGNIENGPKGCVLFKSTNFVQARIMRLCKEAGHVVVAADEEVLASSREDFARSTHRDAVTSCDSFLALSEEHRAALIEAFPEIADRISVAGNARVDLLRSALPPRPHERDYILFNTSFGIINSIWGSTEGAAAVWIEAGGHPPGAETDALVRERVEFERTALTETQDLISWVLNNTNLDVVIRPHPQERSQSWMRDVGSIPRITVVASSDGVPWMRHAVVTVHNESTTGVEAAIMGVPVLNLSPPASWSARLMVSQVNPNARTAGEAADLIDQYLKTQTWPAPKSDPLKIFPSGGAKKTAEAILRALPPRRVIEFSKWKRYERTDIQLKKFSATLDEVYALVDCRGMALDDSLFYLEPKKS